MTTPNSFSGSAQATTLGGAITSTTQSSFTVVSMSSWLETVGSHVGQPLGTSGNFVVCIDYGTSSEERILCSSITGTTINVATVGGVLQRGYDGTTATTHSFGATVVHTISTDAPYQANLGVTNAATAQSAANAAQSTANAALPLTGGTLTGALILAANPTTNLGAATKQYVDAASKPRIWSGNTSITGISGYTNYLVIGTGTYNNPAVSTTVSQYLTLGGTSPLGPASGYVPVSTNTSTNPTSVNLTSIASYSNSGTWNASLSATDTPSASVTFFYQQIIVIGLN